MSSPVSDREIDKVIDFVLSGLRESTIRWFDEANLQKRDMVIVIEKMLNELDRRWMVQKIPLTIIYVASRIIEEVVNRFEYENGEGSAKLGTIILGTMSDDYHSLGKNLVKKFLMPFFAVYDLGVNVSIEKFISNAQEYNADIIAVSALMMNSVLQLKKLKESIDASKWTKKPKLLVGGAPFTIDPELFEHTGADASAPTALVVARECMHLVGVEH
ncbi:MAG: cobalamin-dependent protein [Candidatus Thorarchaeota archaeon]|nr:cobalamin-dependent protein [Candidatus Thorarchaeota archaeon]